MSGDDIRNLVDANFQHDQKIVEFNDFLKYTAIDQYCSSQSTLDQIFAIDSTCKLPKHLLATLQDRRNTTSMGIFPEIQRIWIASGSIVYFWNYVNRTLFTYETDDKVYQIGLLKPKEGIFNHTIEWMLVVNSSHYITAYGVTFTSSAEMKLDVSQRRFVPSGGVKMKSIVSHNSRILMLGADDGHIYEMVYKVDSSQDRLTCQTDEGFHTLFGSSLSSFFKSVLDIKTKSITIDHQRNVIYALSEKSTIKIICLDDGDVTFNTGITITDINEQFVSFLFAPSKSDPMKMPSPSVLDILGSPLAPKPFDIISVHPLPKHHTPATHDIAFYAVTSHGCRLYFSSNEPYSIITEKSTFTLKYVRLTPYENDQPSVLKSSSERLESAFQLQNDVFIAPICGNSNKLWMTSYQQQCSYGDIKIEETSDVMEFKSTIAIIGDYFSSSSFSNHRRTQPSTFYERTNTSINIPHYQLIVVTDDGTLTIYKKQRPVDLVYQSIANDIHLDLALRRFGDIETYAMLLDVLSINSTLTNTHQHILLSLAKQHPDNVNQSLALIYTRIMAHVWKKDILMGDDKDDLYGFLVNCKDDLEKMYSLASNLVGHIYENMLDLLHSSIQVISFITFLKQYHMFTSEPRDANDGICFAYLVTTTNGHDILEKLVNKAIHYFASMGQGQVMVSTYLVDHCPTLFGDANHLALYEGDEYLAMGEYLGITTNETTQTQYDKAMLLFKKSLDNYLDGMDYLIQEKRTQICDTYKRLGYYQGVVTFSMYAVNHPPLPMANDASLPVNMTLTGINKQDQTTDSSHSKDGVNTVLSLLDHVNASSGNVTAILRMTLPIYSHNKALHHAMYTWLIDHDKMQLLFDEQANDTHTTQYLTDFLEHHYDNKPIGMDYLYKYYNHQGNQEEKAVTCLTTLATTIRGISLTQRIQYLNIARTYQQNIDQQQRLESLYQLALVQQVILDRLLEKQNNGDKDVEIDDRLLSRLLGLDDLLKDYAEKYGLWDQALVLMRQSGTSPENGFDYVAMKSAWSSYLSQQLSNDLAEFRSQFVALGKQLYPSITTFPVYLIVFMVESYCLTYEAKKEFAIELLLEIGVPSAVLEDAYDFILHNKLSPSNDHHLHQQLDYLKTSPS